MERIKKNNILYCITQGLYWISYGVAVSFSSVFLKEVGCTNFELGLIMSLGHISGFILSNALGVLIDKYKFYVYKIIFYVLSINLLVVFINSFIRYKTPFLFCSYPIFICLSVTINSLIIKLWTDFVYNGVNINFSVARAVGSFFYILLSLTLGKLLNEYKPFIMPYISMVIILFQMIINYIFGIEYKFLISSNPDKYNIQSEDEALGIIDFCTRYKKFTLLLIGLSVIYLAHYISGSSFLINIVYSVGGDNKSLGYINGYMAFLEIFVLLFYPFFKKKFGCRVLLLISVFCFSLKTFTFSQVNSMNGLFISYLTHIPSYALFIPTIVDYVKEEISYENSAKGQSLAAGVSTIGSCLAGFAGGMLYDAYSVKLTLFIAFLISIFGLFICIFGLTKKCGD